MHQKLSQFPLLPIIVGTLLLLLIPAIALTFGWQWQPLSETPAYLWIFYLLTETGTVPQVLLTCLIFASIPLLYLKLPRKQALICFVIIVGYFGVGQLIKESLKNAFQEERPYVAWLETEDVINTTQFYELKRTDRAQLIMAQDFSTHHIPAWQQKHWSKETGYSFPSGHTIFAAQWFLLYLLLLWRQRAYTPVVLMGLYAAGILISRLLLGMHWPIDLLVSTLLASLIVYPTFFCFKKMRIFPVNSSN